MSLLIECDSCKKRTYVDSKGEEYIEVDVFVGSKRTTYHLCEECYKTKFIDYLLDGDE